MITASYELKEAVRQGYITRGKINFGEWFMNKKSIYFQLRGDWINQWIHLRGENVLRVQYWKPKTAVSSEEISYSCWARMLLTEVENITFLVYTTTLIFFTFKNKIFDV